MRKLRLSRVVALGLLPACSGGILQTRVLATPSSSSHPGAASPNPEQADETAVKVIHPFLLPPHHTSAFLDFHVSRLKQAGDSVCGERVADGGGGVGSTRPGG